MQQTLRADGTMRFLGYSLLFLVVAGSSTASSDSDVEGTCWDPEIAFLVSFNDHRVPRVKLHVSAEEIKTRIRQEALLSEGNQIVEKDSAEEIMARIRRQEAIVEESKRDIESDPTEEIMERIRREAQLLAERRHHANENNDNDSSYTSAEEIKEKIRREALLHIAQSLGVTRDELDDASLRLDNTIKEDMRDSDNDEDFAKDASPGSASSDHTATEIDESSPQGVASNDAKTSTSNTQDEQTAPTPLVAPNITDERTVLDIFGERAKEFLTRKVIPETDTECRWDWRTVRCEPSCECRFQPLRGDYHIGRSCRRYVVENCVPERPWNDHAAARRFLSLATQTSMLVKTKLARKVREILYHAKSHYDRVQDRVCPGMPCTSKTFPEMILCHRSCDLDEDDDDDPSFAGRPSLLAKLQNRFAFNPQQPTEDMGWEF